MSANFTCNLSGASSPLKHAWEHTVGSSRALLALRADWQRQLERCHRELGFRHVRFHGLLNDDMGTLITHKAASRLVKEPLAWKYEEGTLQFDVDLPPHAVAAITLEFASELEDGGSRA